jgi:MFS transporter, ACDE family, multidrug resistance protein
MGRNPVPLKLAAFARPEAPAFLVLFTLDTLARAMLVTVVPLQAYALLGDAQKVSVLYFVAGSIGLCGGLSVPYLVNRLHRRGALTFGVGCWLASAYLLAQEHVWSLIPGLALQMFAGATVTICLSLYVLDNVPKGNFTRFEPMRMFLAGIGWMSGPVVGVYLSTRVAPWAPFLLSAGFFVVMYAYFRYLRVPQARANPNASRPQSNPVKFVRRFFQQPRLTLAWLLSVGRAAWWNVFYIYAPIFAVATGLGDEAGGIISSLGSAGLFTVTFWGWMGRRKGVRWLLIFGYAMTGLISILVGLLMGSPWLGAALLVAAAFGASITDGPGNVPFMRSVHSYERAAMTSVYSTYREAARLSMPAAYSLLLLFFPLPAVFFASGGMMLGLAGLSRYIPHRFGLEGKSTR